MDWFRIISKKVFPNGNTSVTYYLLLIKFLPESYFVRHRLELWQGCVFILIWNKINFYEYLNQMGSKESS